MKCSTFALVLALAPLMAGLSVSTAATASAKDKDLSLQDAIKLCSEFEDDGEKLLCFEALASSVNGKKPAKDTSSKEKRAEAPKKPSRTAKTGASAQEAPTVQSDKSDEEFTVRAEENSADREKPTFRFTRSDSPEGKRQARAAYQNTVYKSWRNGHGELRVAFTNGEIWLQVDKGTRHNPQKGELAFFTPGALGSWDVAFDEAPYAIRMRQSERTK